MHGLCVDWTVFETASASDSVRIVWICSYRKSDSSEITQHGFIRFTHNRNSGANVSAGSGPVTQ